jgi:hypothetical protein
VKSARGRGRGRDLIRHANEPRADVDEAGASGRPACSLPRGRRASLLSGRHERVRRIEVTNDEAMSLMQLDASAAGASRSEPTFAKTSRSMV